ncbi:hypothetical protein MPHL43072_12470 [Mycolicibacterium phlei DSM 43072]|uniref:Uncharacterized protein n=1 Tax=Mycolicibacterium phlei DSM 43239 = CCUG 21000 TaxID=1226750 RepID=A0A5N5V254_MYCPH|nr:hypothetical protein MPHL21000_13730 [Mycolicibacterium phlei DSM 43239 = CCUG 21000]KXW59895.1 hypothetical protein MPHL43072_12470 [Mycolicibacterium phlei DSM 43072]KXW64528.1 hypothetical protein MPHL43239_13600 [Mycolicibacterium phlei DSM 43239 = CCUG 21000]KXW67101.1 hypothetical protein MPHL43070_20325 [Mycolicibacterium phlei DSM 43070]
MIVLACVGELTLQGTGIRGNGSGCGGGFELVEQVGVVFVESLSGYP